MKKSELKEIIRECLRELNEETLEEKLAAEFRESDVDRALKKAGWVFDHQSGSHKIYKNPNAPSQFQKSVSIVMDRGKVPRRSLKNLKKETGIDPERI